MNNKLNRRSVFQYFFSPRQFLLLGLVLQALWWSGAAIALPAPASQQLITPYQAIATPVLDARASASQPVAVGAAADGSGDLELQIRIDTLDVPMDAYFGIMAPEIVPDTLFLLDDEGALQPFKETLIPWKTSISSLDEKPFGSIPLGALPDGTYHFYLLLNDAQQHPAQANYYLWATTLKISKGVILETGEPAAPFRTIGGNGMVTTFHVDPASGKPTGMTFLNAAGQSAFLATDPDTGLPDYLVSDETVLVFSNVRVDEGLLDLGVIYPDGSDAFIQDFSFGPLTTPVTLKSSDLTQRASEPVNAAEVRRQKFLNLYGAFGVTMSVTGCLTSAIVTAGGALGTAGTAAYPPVSLFFFEISATAGATTVACGTALVAFIAMIPEQAAAAGINDVNSLPGLGAAVAECVAKIKSLQFAQCIKTAADAASFAKSSLVNKVYGTYLRMRDGRASLQAPFKVYCCNGPDQIKVDKRGEWRAAVVEGIGKPPFLFDFDFGDNGEFSRPSALTSDYGVTFPYIYDIPGTYKIGVTVIDQNSDKAIADSQITGALKPFSVTVYEEMQLQCCTSSKSAADDLDIELTFSVTGGKKPYAYTVDFGDETRETVSQSIETAYTLKHRYDELNKPKTITLTMTDAEGTKVTKTHQIEANAAPEAPDFQYDFSKITRANVGFGPVDVTSIRLSTGITYTNENSSGFFGYGSIEERSNDFINTETYSETKFTINLNDTGDEITSIQLDYDASSDQSVSYRKSMELHTIPLINSRENTYYRFEVKGIEACDHISSYIDQSFLSDGSIHMEAQSIECKETTKLTVWFYDR